jgi:hypothetical protein
MIDHDAGLMSFGGNPPRRARRLAAATPLLLLVTAAAGFAAHGYLDGATWRTNAPQARSVSSKVDATERDKREAIVMLMRDAQETIRALRAFAADPQVEVQARRAIEVIAEAASK